MLDEATAFHLTINEQLPQAYTTILIIIDTSSFLTLMAITIVRNDKNSIKPFLPTLPARNL